MKKLLTLTSGALLAFATPLITSAAVNNISDVGSKIINIINNVLVPVLFSIAFIVFIWGAFQTFIFGAQDAEVKDKGKNLMLWGLIGFVVMLSVWGLVNILKNTADIGNNSAGPLPTAGVQVGQ